MYVDYSSWETFEYTLTTLNLDLNNPRIKYRGVTLNQPEILKYLIKNEKVYELAKKIAEEGYFVGEEPIICIERDKKIVLEGNRRTGALKLLHDPHKYLSTAKANTLLKAIVKNNFPIDKKLRCYIAPNRLLANPIIYSRHNGTSLHKWATGNQYAFVAEMYYEDGLDIEDICDVLNETQANVIKPLKAYNLFLEGQTILDLEADIQIDIANFNFTNLERFYSFEDGRDFLGIDFNEDNGDLILKISKDEFEKRLTVIFKSLLDSERFSRDFNKDEQKKEYIRILRNNPDFDFTNSSEAVPETKSKGEEERKTLEEKKKTITSRRKKAVTNKGFLNSIIARDIYLSFENEKLDDLFEELKSLPIDKKYSFAILLRTYLEQALSFYVLSKRLIDSVNEKATEERRKGGIAKVDTLVSHLKGKYEIKSEIDKALIMNILKFDGDKSYSFGLKVMLDFIKTHELPQLIKEPGTLKNTVLYLDNVKNELDLAVHNLDFTIDTTHNKRAWNSLFPVFVALSNNLLEEKRNIKMFYSPLRYPGGKNKLSAFIAKICMDNGTRGHYVEPYAGGASVALFLLFEGFVDKITINDKDRSLYAFWHSVLYETNELIDRITNTELSIENWLIQKVIQNNKETATLLDLGFSTLFLNRTNRSGILNGGIIGGKKQDGEYKLYCRFNKTEIISRIKKIHEKSAQIRIYSDDAIDLIDRIEQEINHENIIFYFDPPYYLKGSSLYMNHYLKDDHLAVSDKIQGIHNIKWIVSYDNHAEIQQLYSTCQKKEYEFNHSAYNARVGKEILLFSPTLMQPDIENFNPLYFKLKQAKNIKSIIYKQPKSKLDRLSIIVPTPTSLVSGDIFSSI